MLNIEAVINANIVKKSKENKRDGKISMSALGKCLRSAIMTERKYEEKEPTKYIPMKEQQLRVFAAGYLFENFCVENTKDITVASQIPCEYRGIKGTADAIVKDGDTNILIDWKSVHSLKFGYLSKEGVDENYALQLTGYYLSLKDKYKLSPIGRIVYVEKECLLIKEMAFKFEDYISKVNAKIDLIERARATEVLPNELPVDENGKQPWMCFSSGKKNGVRLWCQYVKFCPTANANYEKALKESGK
jgi:hypothetical protein